MITVVGVWEPNWMETVRTELRLWKQTIQAFEVDVWHMVSKGDVIYSNPIQFPTIGEALAATTGTRVFFIAPGRMPAERTVNWKDLVHPEDAVYVFGSSFENLVDVAGDDIVCEIRTPGPATMFGPVVLGIILADRLAKA